MTVTETRAKYTAGELKAMVAKGHAIKNADGDPSYPVADAEDLHDAIRAVGRGGSDHDAIRRHIISRAKALGLSSQIPDNWGADGSLGGSASAGTPLETLRRRRGSMVRQAERRGAVLEMRAKPDGTGGTQFVFEGYGSVFDAEFDMWDRWGDPYREVVRKGAFAQSLARPDLDVPFLIGHDDSRLALARTRNGTMQLSEDSHGLLVRAVMDGRRSDVRDLAYAVERGDMDEMSIGFVTDEQRWSDDWMTREMLSLNLHRGDVSSVPLAASPSTAGAMMFAMPGEEASAWRPAEELARGEVADNDSHPDFNPPAGPVDNGTTAVKCPYTKRNGCGVVNPGGNRFCGSCGGPMYDGDGLMVLDDSGVVEEVSGAQGDANLLSLRLRLLELA